MLTAQKNKSIQDWVNKNINNDKLWSEIQTYNNIPRSIRNKSVIKVLKKAFKKNKPVKFYTDGIYLAPTKIPGIDELGVYCMYDLYPNTLLDNYDGRHLNKDEMNKLEEKDSKIYAQKRRYMVGFTSTKGEQIFIDPTNDVGEIHEDLKATNFLPFINEPPEGKKANVFSRHWFDDNQEIHDISFITCSNVPANTELYMHYGDNYHRLMKDSTREYKAGKPCNQFPYGKMQNILTSVLDPNTKYEQCSEPIIKTFQQVWDIYQFNDVLHVKIRQTGEYFQRYFMRRYGPDDNVPHVLKPFLTKPKRGSKKKSRLGKEVTYFSYIVQKIIKDIVTYTMTIKQFKDKKETDLIEQKSKYFTNYSDLTWFEKTLFTELLD